jgi:hypothetical protein
MRIRILLTALAALALALATPAAPPQGLSAPQQALVAKAGKVAPESCAQVEDFRECHTGFAAGCSDSDHPNYDAYLNLVKNQSPDPALDPVKVLGESDVDALEAGLPATLHRGNHALVADELAQMGEGNIYALTGYLYAVQPSGAESSNCELTGPDDIDFHILVGFDPAAAHSLAGGQLTKKQQGALKAQAVVVEMTPHTRAQSHPAWDDTLVAGYVGRQVKVVGQLTVDNEHRVPKDDCGLAAHKATCWRRTVWELHPVTQVYICTAEPCESASAHWVKLEDKP